MKRKKKCSKKDQTTCSSQWKISNRFRAGSATESISSVLFGYLASDFLFVVVAFILSIMRARHIFFACPISAHNCIYYFAFNLIAAIFFCFCICESLSRHVGSTHLTLNFILFDCWRVFYTARSVFFFIKFGLKKVVQNASKYRRFWVDLIFFIRVFTASISRINKFYISLEKYFQTSLKITDLL